MAAGQLEQPPRVLDDQRLRVGASIGRAVFPDDADGAEGLLRAADEAMFEAKRGFDRDAPAAFRRASRCSERRWVRPFASRATS